MDQSILMMLFKSVQGRKMMLLLYLDDWMTSRGGFDSSPAALCFIVRSVVSFGLHLDLQLKLPKLAWQGPI